jgi:hypothetical protein
MALVTTGFVGSVTLQDEEGSRATLQYDLTAVTNAAALIDMGDIVTRLAAITDCAISGYSVSEVFAEDTLVLPDGVEVEKRAVISAKLAGTLPQEYVNIVIPGPTGGIFIAATGPDAKRVDPADADLRAYLATFANAGEATISGGQTIVDPTASGAFTGRKTHRGSRNG